MEIYSLASGSSGNAYLVRYKDTSVLLDVGLSGKKIVAALGNIGADPNHLSAVLVTHEHNDHISGAGIISRRFNLPVFMTQGTWSAAGTKLGKLPESNICLVEPGGVFALGDFEVEAIGISHDAQEPVNYMFNNGHNRAMVLTDTGCITGKVLKKLAMCHSLVLESNHDVDMLNTGPYPWHLKQRVASQSGHLSNIQAAKVATWLATKGVLRRLHLGHLSAVNNTPNHALMTVGNFLRANGLEGEEVFKTLQVLPRHDPGPVLQVK